MQTAMPNEARTETEINLNWARENPSLFVDTVASFQNARPPEGWSHQIDLSRMGFVTLIANRKTPDTMVTIRLPVKIEALVNEVISAVEGGSGYWLREMETTGSPTKKSKPAYESPAYSDQQFWMDGGTMTVRYDNPEDGPDMVQKVIDLRRLQTGATIMAEKYPQHFADILNENSDATTADVFIQCVLLGEIVYG